MKNENTLTKNIHIYKVFRDEPGELNKRWNAAFIQGIIQTIVGVWPTCNELIVWYDSGEDCTCIWLKTW